MEAISSLWRGRHRPRPERPAASRAATRAAARTAARAATAARGADAGEAATGGRHVGVDRLAEVDRTAAAARAVERAPASAATSRGFDDHAGRGCGVHDLDWGGTSLSLGGRGWSGEVWEGGGGREVLPDGGAGR